VTIPGQGGDLWVCRCSGQALAYQNYCSTSGTVLVFDEYYDPDKGKTSLHTQEGQWLSYELSSSCLYVYNWAQSGYWKIEGNHLIADDDSGLTLAWDVNQKWPLADTKFLQLLPPSKKTVTVERVEV
jgi:hypothetical protein